MQASFSIYCDSDNEQTIKNQVIKISGTERQSLQKYYM